VAHTPPKGEYGKELPPSSWRQAAVHRTAAFRYSSPCTNAKNPNYTTLGALYPQYVKEFNEEYEREMSDPKSPKRKKADEDWNLVNTFVISSQLQWVGRTLFLRGTSIPLRYIRLP